MSKHISFDEYAPAEEYARVDEHEGVDERTPFDAYTPLDELIPIDWRLKHLSPAARAAVTRFGCDVDEAAFEAAVRVHLYARPPVWAVELYTAQRSGWRFD